MTQTAATLGVMGGLEERGARIRDRMDALGLGLSDLGELAGVARNSVFNATQGRASEKTYRRVEAALAAAEGSPEAVVATPAGLVELEVAGDVGVRVIVKGPVENIDELQAQVAKIIANIRDTAQPQEAG